MKKVVWLFMVISLLVITSTIILSAGETPESTPPSVSQITTVTLKQTWDVDVLQEDDYIDVYIDHINGTKFEVSLEPKQEIPPQYKWGATICFRNESNYVRFQDTTNIYTRNNVPEWCDENFPYGIEVLDKAKRIVGETYIVELLGGVLSDFKVYIGDGTYVSIVNSSTNQPDSNSPATHLFWDSNNEVYHTLIIDDANNISLYKSADGTTWEEGLTIDSGESYRPSDVDMFIDVQANNVTYAHFFYLISTKWYIWYKRCQLKSTGELGSCGSEQTILVSDDTNDDMMALQVKQGPDGCAYVAYSMEDASESSSVQEEINLIKEGGTCGDGTWVEDWNVTDIEGGSYYQVMLSLYHMDDGHPVVVYDDTAAGVTYTLNQQKINKSDGTDIGSELEIDNDLGREATPRHAFSNVMANNTIIHIDTHKSNTSLHAFLTHGDPATSTTQKIFNFNASTASSHYFPVTATVNTYNDDLYVFAIENTNYTDIWWITSTDYGQTWSTPEIYLEDAMSDTIQWPGLRSYFIPERCEIALTYLNRSSGETTAPIIIHINDTEANCTVVTDITSPTTASPASKNESDTLTVRYNMSIAGVVQTSDVSTLNITVGSNLCSIQNTTTCIGTLDCSAYSDETSCNNCSQCNWTSTGGVEENINWVTFDTADEPGTNWTTSYAVDAECLWQRDDDGTASGSTGPCAGASNCATDDAGYDDNWYAYVETSSSDCNTGTGHAYLTYSDLDMNGYNETLVNFAYSMYGADMGNLSFQINVSGGWDVLWSLDGDQGTSWGTVEVNISSYTGVRDIRFDYDRAGHTGYTGDVAIDVLNISGTPSSTTCQAIDGGACSACAVNECDTNCSAAGCTTETTNDEVWTGSYWEVNCTVPSCTGNQDLTIYTSYGTFEGTETESNAVSCGGAAGDSCSCPSPAANWVAQCSDNCNITSNCNIPDHILTVNGSSGTFNILANISVERFEAQAGCQIVNKANDGKMLIVKGD